MHIILLWFLFGIGFLIQICFLVIIFGRVAFAWTKKRVVSDPEKQEGVTVMVTAHNESGKLKHLIPALFQQKYENYDVLIVDDRSNDRTRRLLEEFSGVYPQLQIVTVNYTPDHVSPKKYALTLGVKASKNDVILLTEPGCMPQSENWIAKMTAPIRERGKIFSIGFSGYERKSGILNSWIQFETILTALFYMSFGLWKKPFMGTGRNLAYRRSFFLDIKAFNGSWKLVGGEDELFVNQHATGKNTEIVRDPAAITLATPFKSANDYLLHQKNRLKIAKLYQKNDKLKIGLYAISQALFWIGSIGLLIYFGINQNQEEFLIVLYTTLFRSILFFLIFNLARRKIQKSKGLVNTFLYDFVYLGYFWLIGSLTQIAKEKKWK